MRGSRQNLRAEVEWYLDLERRARERWRKEMQKLEADGPAIRLARTGNINTKHGGNEALAAPTVRLAHKNSGREDGKGLERS